MRWGGGNAWNPEDRGRDSPGLLEGRELPSLGRGRAGRWASPQRPLLLAGGHRLALPPPARSKLATKAYLLQPLHPLTPWLWGRPREVHSQTLPHLLRRGKIALPYTQVRGQGLGCPCPPRARISLLKRKGLASHNFFPPEFLSLSLHPAVPTPLYLFLWPPASPSLSLVFRPPSLTWRVTCLAWCLLLGLCLRCHLQ